METLYYLIYMSLLSLPHRVLLPFLLIHRTVCPLDQLPPVRDLRTLYHAIADRQGIGKPIQRTETLVDHLRPLHHPVSGQPNEQNQKLIAAIPEHPVTAASTGAVNLLRDRIM